MIHTDETLGPGRVSQYAKRPGVHKGKVGLRDLGMTLKYSVL